MINNFLFNNFCVIVSFLIMFITFGILFSKAVNAEVVAKPLIFSISVLTSFIFELRIVLVAKLAISGILF